MYKPMRLLTVFADQLRVFGKFDSLSTFYSEFIVNLVGAVEVRLPNFDFIEGTCTRLEGL